MIVYDVRQNRLLPALCHYAAPLLVGINTKATWAYYS